MSERMDDDDLLSLIEREEADCIANFSSALSEQRRKAMQYYYGQPYGNEVEGRSQVITTEVKDAVEGIMPSLMAIFTSTDEIVRFDPQNPDDDAVAQQATDYANYIFTRLNNGFLALYCLIKDALLQKNGYVKVYWENSETQTQETYEGLNELEFRFLSQNDELELKTHSSYPDPNQPQIPPEIRQQMEQMGQEIPIIMLHDATFRRTKKHGKVCIDPVPPEEVLISKETPNDITKARFVEHRTLRSLSEIREMGFKVEDDIADYAPNADFNLERVQRLSYDDALAYRTDENLADPAMRRVWLCEAYTKVDFDGDGIAELRKITKVGRTLLDNTEFDSLPLIGCTTNLIPHKHYGLSVYDEVGDIQLQKSTVMRQLFDNAYVANNGRMEVVDGMVNMSDLLVSRPNGTVRVRAIGSLRRIENPLLGAPFYDLLGYLDKIKQNRVGSTDFPNAVDPDAINAKAAFVDYYKEAAMERTNLRARLIAETAIKQIFWKIIELVSKHQNKPQMIKLRGNWVKIDPREWANRFDMTVTVGLGTGSQQITINGAMGIMNIQAGMIKSGLANRTVTEKNVYQAARRYAKAVFPKEADAFFTDPTTLPPPQPKPNPEMMDLQLKAHKVDVTHQQKQEKMAFDAMMAEKDKQFETQRIQFEATMNGMQRERDRRMEAQMAALEIERENRMRLVDMIEKMKNDQADKVHDTNTIALQGIIDQLLEQQKANNEQQRMTREAMLAPKEIVRDAKGKATGVRTVN